MNVLNVPEPDFMQDEEIVLFSDSVGKWIDEHAPPEKFQQWIANSSVPRSLWNDAGDAGLLGLSLPEEDGGFGGDYRHEVVLMRQLGWKGADHFGISLHNAIVMPYIWHYGTEEQKARWLPRLASGELVGAIAMTEPGAGSDLQGIKTTAIKSGDHYVLNGSKTFITNGQLANFIIVVAKTDPAEGAKGTSLICLETDGAEGFERGRNLDKLGHEAQDTSELFFNDVKVPTENLLGADEGQGFFQLMGQLPQERLNIAVQGMATIERALELTIAYVKDRKAFGKAIIDFQNTQFVLADMATDLESARALLYMAAAKVTAGAPDKTRFSAMAKKLATDNGSSIVDRALQMFGGYGYLRDYPIERFWRDLRVHRILEGTNEVMRMIVGRDLLK